MLGWKKNQLKFLSMRTCYHYECSQTPCLWTRESLPIVLSAAIFMSPRTQIFPAPAGSTDLKEESSLA